MKKILVGLLSGLVLGGAATWLLLSRSVAPASDAIAPAAEKAGPGLHLSKEQVAQAGLSIAVPGSVRLVPEVTAYGRVLDSAPLLTLAADLAAAQATLSASEKEFARLKALHEQGENASAQAVETAEAAAQRDRSALDSVRARLNAGWGPALASRTDLPGLLRILADGQASLARLDLLPGDRPASAPGSARVGALADESALREAEVLGPAPTVDPQMQGTGYLVLLRGTGLPPPGSALRAFLPAGGGEQVALVVPRTALVQHQGSVFVYVQTGDGVFARKLVELGRVRPEGIAITGGLGAEDRVVTVGGQQLLSTELQSAGVTGN